MSWRISKGAWRKGRAPSLTSLRKRWKKDGKHFNSHSDFFETKIWKKNEYMHCVESICIWSHSGLCFPVLSVLMRKNTDHNNSEYGHFLRSDWDEYLGHINFFFLFCKLIKLFPLIRNWEAALKTCSRNFMTTSIWNTWTILCEINNTKHPKQLEKIQRMENTIQCTLKNVFLENLMQSIQRET